MTSEEKDQWQKEMKRQSGVIFSAFFGLSLILVGWFLSRYIPWLKDQWWMPVAWVVFVLVYALHTFFSKLVPENILFGQVEEGMGKTVMKLGQAHKGLIQYKGFTLDDNWNIIPGQEKHLLGGLRWIGIWPIYYVFKYMQRWTSVRESGEAVYHEDGLDSLLLKEKIYHLNLEGAEDKDGIALNIDILLTLRVVNPYKALFGPHNYLEQVLNRTRPLFREYVRNYTFMKLSAQKQRAGGELWKRLEHEHMVNKFDKKGELEEVGEFERDYGVRVKDGGIEMKRITPPPEYQEAQTKKYKAGREAERLAGEIAGTLVNSMANFYGISPDQVREKIGKNTKDGKGTKIQKEFRDVSCSLVEKILLAERGAYKRFEVSKIGGGSQGEEGMLDSIVTAVLNVIALGKDKDTPMGGQNSKQEKKNKQNKKEGLSRGEKMKRLKNFKEKGGKLDLIGEEGEGEGEE